MFTVKGRKKRTIAKTVRFDGELYSKLKEAASKAGISVNELISQCCEYAKDNFPAENDKYE
jgi:predicted HicB family RNase H-like nuclease